MEPVELLQYLSPSFQEKAKLLIHNCKDRNVFMKPIETIRTPQRQARLWCQSRKENEINNGMVHLKQSGASFLAECISLSQNVKSSKNCTNAMPGFSWHQWGEAMDCCWMVDNKACWDLSFKLDGFINGYEVYAEEASLLGLNAGLFWELKDACHVQLRSEGSPGDIYSIKYIDEMMEQFYHNI